MNALLASRSPRELAIVAGCLTILIAAALALYVIKPQWERYQAALAKHELLSEFANEDTSGQRALDALGAEVARLQTLLEGDSANLPSQEIEAFVIGRLQTISWRHGLDLIAVEPAKGEVTDEYQELLFQVEISGDYFGLNSWLNDLSAELGFVVIREYQISINGGDDALPILRTQMLLASYRMRESEQ
ncbi:MAG: type 4a pilus biogenesis protein PilO [Pseudomonadaceae bacterium]|nr:type 4a pilus biogenesis protein PilO [Pseudomonadaceae bacterium]